MKAYSKYPKSSWQNWVVGKLAKRFANYIKPQWTQGLIGSWQVGNCQLTLPTYQLGLIPCIYWVLSLLVVGNTTPLYNIIITLTLIIIFIGVCVREVSV